MKMTNDEYKKLVDENSPKSKLMKNSAIAFGVGGLICAAGQGLLALFEFWGLDEEAAGMCVAIALIFIASLLTAAHLFDNIAKHAGAGTLIPITGFANAIVSPAMEFKSEGLIAGVAAKMFTIAGPVLVYGILASVVYGVIYSLFGA